MQTYSHFLVTAVLDRGLKRRKSRTRLNTKALLLGSVMPDVPLFLLSLGFLANRARCGLSAAEAPICGPIYDDLYFNNPWWIVSHNLWHAPVHIVVMLFVGYYFGWRRQKAWGVALFWFAVACGFHSVIDIFTHHTDGPLIFFPFNWEYRYPAPVSYWDRNYGAAIFAPLEHLLDAAIVGTFLVQRIKRRRGEAQP